MSSAVAAPFEMTLQEARDRVELAYGLFEKARIRFERSHRIHRALIQQIDRCDRLYSLYRTLDLLDPRQGARFTDYLRPIYKSHEIEPARKRIRQALDREGPRSTFETLRGHPESFGELPGDPKSPERLSALERADRLGRNLEAQLLEPARHRPSAIHDQLHVDDPIGRSMARCLPEAIARLTWERRVGEELVEKNFHSEILAQRYLAETARVAGGSYFARTHLGPEVGAAVSTAIEKHPEAALGDATRFTQLHDHLEALEETAKHLRSQVPKRAAKQTEESEICSRLRFEQSRIERRSRLIQTLVRDRDAFRHHLSEAYRSSSLPSTYRRLSLHTQSHGRVATAKRLAETPARFGLLRGFPATTVRRRALDAIRQASHRLWAFEKHRGTLCALPGCRPRWYVSRLEAELARIRPGSHWFPLLRSYQRNLARAVEKAGGLESLSPHLSATGLTLIDRALRLTWSLEGGHER